ncbi:MAG: lecithin retinol acyltransferase family protein [Pelobium sp.]
MANNLLNLKPADRVVIPKTEFQIVQHHGIYLGQNSLGTHLFAENNIGSGVKILSADNFFGKTKLITRIEKFQGSISERNECIKRALALQGKTYDLLEFNCEHYSNIIQHNTSTSSQVNNGIILSFMALAIGGLIWSNNGA